MKSDQLLLTCEHGGYDVPAPYRALFRKQESLLRSHRGWDPGALEMARALSQTFRAPLFYSQTTRLVVDLNRSPHHRNLFSEFTLRLDPREREILIRDHYTPHREKVEDTVNRLLNRRSGRGSVALLHVAVHSFTPVLNGEVRRCDLGLLYDPRRARESVFAARWSEELKTLAPAWRIRRNYPYRGDADGLTTHLRRVHDESYLGIELEINQERLTRKEFPRTLHTVTASLDAALHRGGL